MKAPNNTVPVLCFVTHPVKVGRYFFQLELVVVAEVVLKGVSWVAGAVPDSAIMRAIML